LLNLIYNENIKLYYRKNTVAMIISLAVMTVLFAVVARVYDYAPNRVNVWDAMGREVWLMLIVTVFTLIVASGIIANEFSWGTIKFLLIRPISRSRILLSKYIALIFYSLLMTTIVFSLSFITNSCLYSYTPNLTHLPTIEGEKAIVHNTLYSTFTIFALKYLEVVMYGTIGFMASVLSRNTAFATGFSLITMF
jgi:ABC-2 type transport system permease protein